MNRELRRKAAKKYTPQFVEREVDKHLRSKESELVNRISKSAAEYMFAVLALSLRDEFGFGAKRIARVVNSMNAYSAPIVDGDITVTELEAKAKTFTAEVNELLPGE
jgi:hypothetical protein